MTTRADLRAAVRLRLADAASGSLWDDTALNDLLAEALREYGTRFPRERSMTVSVTAGSTSVAIVPPVERHQIVQVFDPAGEAVPRQRDYERASTGQAWDWWESTLRLVQPAAGGIWRIDYLDSQWLPADDATPVEIPASDEAIVVTLAAAIAMRRRAVEDAKLGLVGGQQGAGAMAERLQRDAERMIAVRRRRARGGWLSE